MLKPSHIELAEVQRVTQAIAAGSLSARANVSLASGDSQAVLLAVNEMLDAVIGPLNVAANFVEQISKGAIPAKITGNYNGDFNAIKSNLNQCIDGLGGLREAAEVVQRMANNDHSKEVAGNYLGIFADLARGVNVVQQRVRHVTSTMRSVAQGNLEELAEYKKIARRSENDELVPAIITMMESLETLVADTNMLSKAAVDGKLATRADASRHHGDFRKVVQGVNDTLDSVIEHLDLMPAPAMIIDRDFTIQYMNATGAHVGGKSPEQVVGTKCYDHFKTEDCRTEKCACAQAMRAEHQASSETVARPSTGLQLDISYTAVPMRDKANKIVGAFEVVTDQTAVKNAARLSQKVSDYQGAETAKLVNALGRLAQGNTDCAVQIAQGDADTAEARETFETLSTALNSCVDAVNALVADSKMLTEAAVAERFESRADGARHSGHYRKIVEGVNRTLDVVVEKLNWYQAIIDAVPFPIHVIDSDMKWVFLNKAFEKLMVDQRYVRDRKDAVGRPCSTAGANICNTEKCGIMQLKRGNGESFFDWCGMNCKQDTSNLVNIKGQHVGYVEVVQDLSATLSVRDYTVHEVKRLAANLGQLAEGNLNIELKTPEAGKYTGEAKAQFDTINESLSQLKSAVGDLITDATKLSNAAVEGKLATRADASKHKGDFRKIVQGVNDTLDAVIGPLNVAADYVDQISKGVIPSEITDSYAGDFNTIKNNLNTCIAWFKELVAYITAMANGDMTATMNKASAKDQIHEWLMLLKASLGAVVDDANTLVKAAADGKLSVRADAARHKGEYRRIVEGLNNTLEAVVTPLNVAGEFIERISQGDLTGKITESYAGDFNTLINSINALVDNLSRFAQEVQAAADQVATGSEQSSEAAQNLVARRDRTGLGDRASLLLDGGDGLQRQAELR